MADDIYIVDPSGNQNLDVVSGTPFCANIYNFGSGQVTVDLDGLLDKCTLACVSGSGGGGSFDAYNEGAMIAGLVTKIDFVGTGVNATASGSEITVTVPGTGLTDGNKGDITLSSGGTNWQINADAVTNVDLANMPSNTIKGNNTGLSADPIDLTVTQARTLLDVAYVSTSTVGELVIWGTDGTEPTLRSWDDVVGFGGIVTRTGPGATTARAISGGTGIAVTNGNGSLGNPSIALSINSLSADTSLSSTDVFLTHDGTNHVKITADNVRTFMLPDGDKGEITVASNGTAWTVDNNVVTNAKLADMATGTIKGNNSGSTGDPLDLNTTQVKSMLAIQSTDISNFAEAVDDRVAVLLTPGVGIGLTYSDTFNALSISSVLAARDEGTTLATGFSAINFVGAGVTATHSAGTVTVTIPGGLSAVPDGNYTDITVSGTGTVWNINADTVGNTELANMSAFTLKGNNTGGAADPIDLNAAQVKTMLAIASTDITDFAEGVDDRVASLLVAGSAITLTYNDAGNTLTIASSGVSDGAKNEITVAGSGTNWTVNNDIVTNAKLANMAANTIKGNNTGTSGDPLDLTVAQTKTLLAIQSTDISNFNEAAQDAVGGIMSGTTGITVVYSDAGNTITVSSNIVTQNEGSTLTSSTKQFNFTGAGVTATNSGSDVTVNIPGISTELTIVHNSGAPEVGDVAIDTGIVYHNTIDDTVFLLANVDGVLYGVELFEII